MNPSINMIVSNLETRAMQSVASRSDLQVVRANGDSMAPCINDGDRVTIRRMTDMDEILYGQVYLVVTQNYTMLKRVKRYAPDEDNYVILHSDNPNYDDMKTHKSKILALYLVEHVFSFRTLAQ
jgi:phage repressor protein C with HTH and peptisase S24 domain